MPDVHHTMIQDGRLRAWIEPSNGDAVIAAFIGVTTRADGPPEVEARLPAMRACSSVDTARQWIETEAAALGLPVEWVEARL